MAVEARTSLYVPAGQVAKPASDTPAADLGASRTWPAEKRRDTYLAELAEFSEPEVRKWPPAASAALVVGACGAFWAAVGIGVILIIG